MQGRGLAQLHAAPIRIHTYKGPFKYYVIKKVGGFGKMLTFSYKVGGWVWQIAYIIIRITGKKIF